MGKMGKKDKRSIPLLYFIISIIFVIIISVGGTYFYLEKKYTVQLSEESAETGSGDLAKIQELYSDINTNYVGDVDKDALVEGALKGMTDALGDPYTTYLDTKEAEDLNTTLSGSFEGIGVSLMLENEIPVISQAPITGSPAEKTGLKSGDIILKVGDEETKGETLSDVVAKIRGKKGSEVKLTIRRAEEEFTVTIVRGTIPVESVTSQLDSDDSKIGDIQITSFAETTFDEVQAAVDALNEVIKAAGPVSWVEAPIAIDVANLRERASAYSSTHMSAHD